MHAKPNQITTAWFELKAMMGDCSAKSSISAPRISGEEFPTHFIIPKGMALLGSCNLAEAELRRVVDHVFLPRKLPGRQQEGLVIAEANLLELLAHVLGQSDYTILVPEKTKTLFKTWADIQSAHAPTGENISAALGKLGKDDMFGYYVRSQNAAFMISIENSSEATISTFPASLKSSTIMSSFDEIISAYPEQSIRIPYSDLLKSPALARQLVTLTNEILMETLDTTKKGGVGNAEIRDVPDTLYVSEWFTSILCNSKSGLDLTFPTICKKVRDNVVWDKALLPFRRSGMWMSLKVILHLSLLRSKVEREDCIVLYKLILAEFMRRLCEAGEKVSLEPDIGMHMMKKLARRVMKLKEIKCSQKLKMYVQGMHTNVSAIIKSWKSKMTVDWKSTIERRSAILPELTVEKCHVVHEKLPKIPTLDGENKSSSSLNESPSCFPRHRVNRGDMPKIGVLVNHPVKVEALGNILYDIEAWLLNKLNDSSINHRNVLTFSQEYIGLAAKHYKSSGNPVGASRMVLTFLKIVHAVDCIAVEQFPLLLEHRAGIDLTIFEQLLLPLKSDLELAYHLEAYFKGRDLKAKYPSLVEEDGISEQSFSARYASGNEEMLQLRDKILAEAEDKIKEKLGEVKEAKTDCESLRRRIGSLSCTGLSHRGNHNEACAKCYTQQILNDKRVKVYERPLRNEPENQLAVVFELLIPPEIASVRDVLSLLLSDICCAKRKSHKIENRIWTKYSQISKHSRGTQKLFQLGSSTKLFVDSHYCEKHPDFPENDFIVDNGYNCTFDGNFEKTWNVKNYCTLGIEPNSMYSILEWTLKTTDHFQNQVLARQSECPQKLRLVEYKEFGSLRAGHRLQLRNILRSLVEKTLSFKEEAVFTLICQCLWETGPQPGNGSFHWYRDSHEDLVNSSFTEKMLRELYTLLDTYEHNWAEPYTLLTTIVLVCRLIEFGLFTAEATKLLLKCRTTAFDWIKRVEDMIAKSYESNSPTEHIQDLKLKLVDACICLCFTYSVGDQYLDAVLRSDQDLFYWLHAMARIYNNITSSATTTLSAMKQNLIRQVQNIALNIEMKLINFVRRGLDSFVKENWNEARNGVFGNWTSFPSPADQVYHTTFQRKDSEVIAYLQVDIIRGSFLINGFPVGYLPENITKHPTFSRTFKNIVFEIRPAVEAKTFITSHEFNNAFYLFTLLPNGNTSDGNTLIIRERNTNTGEEFQLVSHTSLKGLIPRLLVEDHSHWLNVSKNWIDFRPICYEEFKKFKSAFRFNLNTKLLEEVSSDRQLFSIRSATQVSITNFLSRLEHSEYIHTFLDKKTDSVAVELPRMKLRFEFKEELRKLKSLEYNMLVRGNQNIDTLIGLESGLVLENGFSDVKILMPHGVVHINTPYSGQDHQTVKIQLKELKEPSLFTFDLDKRLQKLRAGKTSTAWLYLAYLHAITSSPLADPFTGLTGTESAFGILQSGYCWSCKPYENEDSITTLEAIRKLSPLRLFYPPKLRSMEQITWPTGLPVSGAHDGFRLIADKLIRDSIRLVAIFQEEKEPKEKKKDKEGNELFLTQRAFIRYDSLCSKEIKICRSLYEIPARKAEDQVGVNGRNWTTEEYKIKNTRFIAELGHSWTFSKPGNISLVPFLAGGQAALSGFYEPTCMEIAKMSIVTILDLDFRNYWINLYELGRRVQKSHFKPEWTIILSILAFRGVDINQLLLLQGVAVHRVFFQAQHPSAVREFTNPSSCYYNTAEIEGVLNLGPHSTDGIRQAQVMSTLLKTLWPIDSCSVPTFEDLPRNHVVKLESVIGALNEKLSNWNRNRELNEFLRKIETTTLDLPDSVSVAYSKLLQLNFTEPLKLHLTSKKLITDFNTILRKTELDEYAKQIYCTNIGLVSLSATPAYSDFERRDLLTHLEHEKVFLEKEVNKILKKIEDSFIFSETELLYASDLVRLNPTSLLRRIVELTNSDENVNILIGALGVLWTLQQRVNRCFLYYSLDKAGIVQLKREVENPGHENWIPSEHPEWLLFEVEMNLMIRSVQIDVTRQMINPPNGKHSVMQLNMGEGKTAVIVPLLALALGNGKQVCRVTVLKSLFRTNFASLVFNLGGLLNRRIYMFPCRRDMLMNGHTAETMLKIYKECQEQGGVVLTLPEYRLSFQLKGYEKCRAKEFDDARSFVKVQHWLSQNVRDILDESDEILHAKYQLIYTLGSQLTVDGGPLRWSVAQSLLKLIPARAVELQQLFGNECVDTKTDPNEPEIFHHTRILKKECYQQLIDWLASDILDGKSPGIKLPVLDEQRKQLAHRLLTNTAIDSNEHEAALELFDSIQEETILILMGYLKYDILYLTLSKRWRVNYGVDKEGDRRMAIPFRAKDLPAKRTEFGHSDVAIVLTQLSYYYSGLSDEELEECFERLDFVSNKEQEYASWINEIPASRNVNASIRDFNSINLTDFKQKYEYLFPELRRNRLVIDFWLSHTVFPKESRAFEKKLVCTAWDLCPESFKNPVTGFSGTNDTTVLLPLPISQQDLPQLQGTNDELRNTILLPENNNYTVLERGITGIEIIKSLVEKKIPILLDSGALMLELSNEKVAEEWLKLLMELESNTYEAAVYFDDNHNLRVKDINHLDDSSPYDLSPYREKMDLCVVYLDDAHTRGTDLKIPPPSSACVTLCAGITRDKMVQACMRMRLLGKGHTVSFYASDEAANGIHANAIRNIGAQDLSWVYKTRMVQQEMPMPQYVIGETIRNAESTYTILPLDITETYILQRLAINGEAILLDTGGLMSRLSNQDVAEEWLLNSTGGKWEAAVYFDNDHSLVLKRLDEEDIFYCSSSYVTKAGACLFYVDIAHARNGDYIPQSLKPEVVDSDAVCVCVTVCAGITPDDLVHSLSMVHPERIQAISFLASKEASLEIESIVERNLGSKQVMDWVCDNSRKFEQDGLVYWSGSGINYAHKQAVESIFERTAKSNSDYTNLGERCCDQDFITLKAMYGEHRQDIRYTQVLESQIERKKGQIYRQLRSNQDYLHPWLAVTDKFDSVGEEIVGRCEIKIGDKRVLGQLLDEEHEKENEEEAEEEQEISRPSPRDPAKHILSPHVALFVRSGVAAGGLNSGDILKLHLSLQRTSLFVAEEWCAESLFVSKDFVNVIKSNNSEDKEDEFLRTPHWIAAYQNRGVTEMLVLSPFEANEIIPTIRSGNAVVNLRMFAPRMLPRQSILTNSLKLALSPTSGTKYPPVPVPEKMLAPLFFFSGTLYFGNEAEHNAYCYFTGILPRNWTRAEEKAFQAGRIDNRGFIPQIHRPAVSPLHGEFCHFSQHPERVIRGIIESRHGLFPATSHVSKVVLDCRRVTNFET